MPGLWCVRSVLLAISLHGRGTGAVTFPVAVEQQKYSRAALRSLFLTGNTVGPQVHIGPQAHGRCGLCESHDLVTVNVVTNRTGADNSQHSVHDAPCARHAHCNFGRGLCAIYPTVYVQAFPRSVVAHSMLGFQMELDI